MVAPFPGDFDQPRPTTSTNRLRTTDKHSGLVSGNVQLSHSTQALFTKTMLPIYTKSDKQKKLDKKLSYRWQTARRLCTPMLHTVLSGAALWWRTANYWLDCTYIQFSHLTSSIPSSYRVHMWYRKTRTARLQSGEGRMMIDSVVWAQYITVTAVTHAQTAD